MLHPWRLSIRSHHAEASRPVALRNHADLEVYLILVGMGTIPTLKSGNMNTRDYKKFAPGEYYHIFNRGNGKMDIFIDEDDYRIFVHRIREAVYALPSRSKEAKGHRGRTQLPEGAFTLIAYCLMPNHYHLLIRQETKLPLSALMLKVRSGYGKYFNKKYDRVGSLFQDQFKAVHINTDTSLKHLSAYIHQNPTVAGLVERAEEWPYSSYRKYMSESTAGSLSSPEILLSEFKDRDKYKEYVE